MFQLVIVAIILLVILTLLSKLSMFEGLQKIANSLRTVIIIVGMIVIFVKTGLLRMIANVFVTFFIGMSDY